MQRLGNTNAGRTSPLPPCEKGKATLGSVASFLPFLIFVRVVPGEFVNFFQGIAQIFEASLRIVPSKIRENEKVIWFHPLKFDNLKPDFVCRSSVLLFENIPGFAPENIFKAHVYIQFHFVPFLLALLPTRSVYLSGTSAQQLKRNSEKDFCHAMSVPKSCAARENWN